MPEELIIRHCSPTLAGIKTGNLFSVEFDGGFLEDVRALNKKLVPKGLRVLPVRIRKNRALVYVYRPKMLHEDFSKCPVRELLEEYGYSGDNADLCIVRLFHKLQSEACFPHEIGLFLGYPPEDVRGFIENKAEGCKCCGCWKVYGDEKAARKRFAMYRKCTDVYISLWKAGRTIERLAVAG